VKITLMKFGAKWCGPCDDLAKARTLEKFAKAHPEVRVEKHDDNAAGTSKAWEKLADEYKVQDIPVLIWVAGGKVLLKTTNVSPAGIESQYKKVLAKL